MDHLQDLVPGVDFASLAHRALRQHRAEVVVACPGLQADAQATGLTESLQLAHLGGGGGS